MQENDESLDTLRLRTRSISRANLHEIVTENDNEFVSIDANHTVVVISSSDSDNYENCDDKKFNDLNSFDDNIVFEESSQNNNLNNNIELNIKDNMYCQIDTVLKIIPEFDGSSNKLNNFIDNCDIASKRLDKKVFEDETIFLDLIKTKLKDKAYNVIRYKKISTYAELKKELNLQFSDSRPVEQLQAELVNLRQLPRESVRDFASKIEKTLFELNAVCIAREGDGSATVIENLNNGTALNTFVNGLYEPIRRIVKPCHSKTLKDAISEAIEEESVINSKKNLISCNICHRKGHIARNCFKNNSSQFTYNNNNFSKSSNNSFNKTGNSKSNSINNNSSAQFNNSFNPQLNSTRNNNTGIIRCFYCKNVGHKINECRKRAFKNQQTQSSISSQNVASTSASVNLNTVSENSENLNLLSLNKPNTVVRANEI